MFHIFYVNKGYMLVLEPPALGSVYDLQKCIFESTGVEVPEQVLFLSGGESVMSNELLSSYMGSGSDSSPIYLIRRITTVERESVTTPEKDGINNLFQSWQSGVEKAEKASTSAIIGEYVKIGKYSIHVADTIFKFCAKVVSEHQHLNQGWMAVISNLDDHIIRIQKRVDRSVNQAEKLDTLREKGRELLTNFGEVINTLSKIVVPAQLLTPYSSTNDLSESVYSVDDTTLYDYISSKDPTYSLNVIVDHVLDHLEKTDGSDLVEAKENFEAVRDLIRKPDYRDIRGIDKRLATLNMKLNALEGTHALMKELANHIIQPPVQDSTSAVISYQRAKVEEFSKAFADFYNYAICFIDSKVELLKNISQRFAGWVRQAYERLQQASKRIILFEEKYTGLRQRLDMVRQIKEAPIMYVTAVSEEFTAWMNTFVDRCGNFIVEENKLRSQFSAKLEKHFLRQLFNGMGDRIPNFCPAAVKIDENLPRVSVTYLKELRKTFPEMQELLKVTTPQVYSRLIVVDPNVSASSAVTPNLTGMRRDESFFVREQTTNIDTMNRNFPSTNWLSEENIDMSPANNFLITKAGLSSNTSLNIDTNPTTPLELCPLSELSSTHQVSEKQSQTTLKTSEPIAIVTSRSSTIKQHDGDKTVIGSNFGRSSRFSTPDDNFESFGSRYAKNSPIFQRMSPKISRPSCLQKHHQVLGEEQISQSLELVSVQSSIDADKFRQRCFEIQSTVSSLTMFIEALKKSIEDMKAEMRAEAQANLDSLRGAIRALNEKHALDVETIKSESAASVSQQVEERSHQFETERKELKDIVEHERYLRREKEKELDEQRRLVEKLSADNLEVLKAKDTLQSDYLKVEQERRRLAYQIRAESSIDYLSIELKAVEQMLKRELTADEVQQIKREIERRKMVNDEVSSTESSPQQQHQQQQLDSSIRSDYERAFRNKMDLIVRGVEEKKNKEIVTLRNEIEEEVRQETDAYIKKLKQRINDLQERLAFFESTDASFVSSSADASTSTNVNTCSSIISDVTNSTKPLTANASQTVLDSMETSTSEMLESCVVLGRNSPTNSSTKPESQRFSDAGNLCNDDSESSLPSDKESPSADSKCDKDSEASDDTDVAALSVYSRGTQTRIRMRDLRMMIALTEVYEGCSVLIMWDCSHNTYIVFSTSPTLHFVKESSIARLGINPKESTRRSWMFAVVNSIEMCQIRKAVNRYNLPINTRFNRVSVDPLPLDFPSSSTASQASGTSISNSKR